MHGGDKGPARVTWRRWAKRGRVVERQAAAAKDQHESEAQSAKWDFTSICAYAKWRQQESVRRAAGAAMSRTPLGIGLF